MKLTDQQRAAVKTWRAAKEVPGSIVSDLPFSSAERPLNEESAKLFGGKFFVAENMGGSIMRFILAATKAAAENEQ